jgi:hypothetical protein
MDDARGTNLVAASLAACALTLSGVTPTPAAAAPSQKAGTAASEVRSVYRDAAGVTHIKEWLPAPGVSTTDLYKRLQQKGEQHLVAPSTLAAPNRLSPNDLSCDINGANALEYRCSNFIHWSGTHPLVHILDHTGPQWPVYSAASVWNQSTALDVGYGWYTNGCPGFAHCFPAWDADYGDTGWAGWYSLNYDGYSQIIDNTVYIQLNDHYSYTSGELMQDACHEIGHTLGIDENFYLTSCVYRQVETDASRYPAAGDYSVLTEIYG